MRHAGTSLKVQFGLRFEPEMNGARNKGADPGGGGDRGKYSINISLS